MRQVKANVSIPVAVKFSHFFSAIANMGKQLDAAGANGLVLFNRFYQPDFDIESLEVVPSLTLSRPQELLLRLHWVAILYGWVRANLAVTGGVHSAQDVLKSMMAGAHVAMMTSALLQNGIDHAASVLKRPGPLDGRARIRIDPADARQYEPAFRIRSGGFRARQLHARTQFLRCTDHEAEDRTITASCEGASQTDQPSKAKMHKMASNYCEGESMADTGEGREIKARTDAKEAEVVAESKKLLQKSVDRHGPDIAQTPSRQQEGNSANEPFAEWLQVTRVSGLAPF